MGALHGVDGHLDLVPPPPLLDQAALGDGPDPQVLDEFGHLQIQIELLATKPIHAN